ncbi:glyoxal oxidase N-terminus-domain-containing protein [Mycena floridula]|nr:glyoxal oxidase N-terminus-domain-containing protein [Mycena floridula]
MIPSPLSLLALWLASAASPTLAAIQAGSFADAGNTKVSAMMMFVGNSKKVYILDKAEGNAAQINGHSAWGAVWDMDTHEVDLMDITTNVFCASGMHLPNGSFATFGGNGAIGPGGNIGSVKNEYGSGAYDATYQDADGTKAIRLLDSNNCDDNSCTWFDNPAALSMQKQRWYSAAEPLGDGSIAIIGGFVNGGYVNRNFPNVDPEFEGGAAESTFEFYPSNGQPATPMKFMIDTSGLNSYAHSFLMSSGKMFVQANISTMLWEPSTNTEIRLPDMPNNVARVYPASGAVAMLPLTPDNNYLPTILFCGGSDMPADAWGNYSYPAINTWNYPASKDCQRITPEPADGSSPVYVQDDDMLEGRTMGQFIILPTGELMVLNGGINGTAGYATATNETPNYSDMPFGMSLASGPVLTPAIYNPNAASGQRWSNAGFAASTIPRLYHSSAVLLPDASILIAGSNPNVDVNLTTIFATEYRAELFYPSYFSATTRPNPSGVPSKLSYGGDSFDITIPSSSYSGSGNAAAESAMVTVVRTGWTTHAMNMGQRFLQLNSTYTVNKDGSIVLHTSQMPPNANIFQPGPAFIYVVVNGIPSNGTYCIIGSGNIGTQPISAASVLPGSVQLNGAGGSADSATTGSGTSSSLKTILIAAVVGAIVLIGIIGAIIGICLARRRRAKRAAAPLDGRSMMNNPAAAPMMADYSRNGAGASNATLIGGHQQGGPRNSDSSSLFLPLKDNNSQVWNPQSPDMNGPPSPYLDDRHSAGGNRGSGMGMSMEYDPYSRARMSPNPAAPHHQPRY